MILLIDNYDSFTYNLVQYFGELGVEQKVVRNDQIRLEEIKDMSPHALVISPGPCTPRQAGISIDAIKEFYKSLPILGVCLGHQAIGEAFGGRVCKASAIYHGKTSDIHHSQSELFTKVPTPFTATRYHSLIVEKTSLPSSLEVTAWTEDGTIMGIQHKEYPVFGVQFHPESIATDHGKQILKNFLTFQ